jgi:hypothetical protein
LQHAARALVKGCPCRAAALTSFDQLHLFQHLFCVLYKEPASSRLHAAAFALQKLGTWCPGVNVV